MWVVGIKAKRKAVKAMRSLPVEKKLWTAAVTSWPTVSQQEVKKHPENPSEPGELKLSKEKTACLISRKYEMTKSWLF